MEALSILEEKIIKLLDHVAQLKEENNKLAEENARFKEQNEALENSLLKNNKNIDDLNQEKTLTRMVVDDLIKNIDSLVSSEHSEHIEKEA